MKNLKAKKLLIVDDEPDIAEILTWELEALGAQCTVAHGVGQALALFQRGHFDGIISDIRMPEQSGIELLKAVRSSDTQIPVLLMTGFADLSLPRAHDLGAEALINKPFELDELCRTVIHYTRPLIERWEVQSLSPGHEVLESDLAYGRGGFLINTLTVPCPRSGEQLNLRIKNSALTYGVTCRWKYGEAWAAEVMAWDSATKAVGWAHSGERAFIPLTFSN